MVQCPNSFRRWFVIAMLLLVCLSFTFFSVYLFRVGHHHKRKTPNIQELQYTQVLDHFSTAPSSGETFQQRYFLDDTYWAGGEANGPIFVVLGGAYPISSYVSQIGVLDECVPQFRALVIYIEVPLGVPYKNWSVRGYLTVTQALADYEQIIENLKVNLSAVSSPVIVLGSYYGGALATLLVMKYPNVAVGALSSSAPMYSFYKGPVDSQDDFCAIVSRDFMDTNPDCHNLISQSWTAIDNLASQSDGLDILSSIFKTCSPLQSAYELKSFLVHMYAFAAQYSGRFNEGINKVCDAIMSSFERDIIYRIADAVFAVVGTAPCIFTSTVDGGPLFGEDINSMTAWNWQQCSEFVIPIGCNMNSLIPSDSFSLPRQMGYCQQQFGRLPPTNQISDQFGGNDLRGALSGVKSHIIMSNGGKDPYSSLGILKDISHAITIINTEQGSQSLDFAPAKADDPKWLVSLRKKEVEIMAQWIGK